MIPFTLAAWALKHHVSDEAIAELRNLSRAPLSAMPPPTPPAAPATGPQSEAWVQSAVRLEAPHVGVMLWRNNVGALEDKTGRWVRYGLANDSKPLNDRLKSADLIGWRPVLIGPQHVGQTIAQFVSRECKPVGWKWSGSAHEIAQQAWVTLVLSEGGDAAFTTGPGSL